MAKIHRSSFKKGFSQLPAKEAKLVREEIIQALGLKCRTSFYARLNGTVEPKWTEHEAIEEIFAKHGISDPWGE